MVDKEIMKVIQAIPALINESRQALIKSRTTSNYRSYAVAIGISAGRLLQVQYLNNLCMYIFLKNNLMGLS
jgi:hypothetical protein